VNQLSNKATEMGKNACQKPCINNIAQITISFFSFMMNISGAKFKEHCFNTFRDIFYFSILPL